MKRLEVEEGLFLLGDNRNLARDSRDYGTVDPEECLGRAIFLFEPAQNNGGLGYEQRRFKWIE
jgi:type IV secretory pathway protease TraF